MFVIKRDGSKEPLNIEQIRKQTIQAVEGLKNVSYEELEFDSKLNFQDGIKTSDIQSTLIKTAISKVNVDTPDWTYVAQRLALYDLYHRVKRNYGKKVRGNVYELITLQDYIYKNKNIFSDWVNKYNEQEIEELNSIIDSKRDLLYDYAGFCLMENMYLAKNEGKATELPQHFHMGVSMFIMQNEDESKRLSLVKEMYHMVSKLEYINATPINSNGRKKAGGLISCLLVTVDDSLDSIMAKTTELAKGSRLGSGYGVDVSRIRSVGSDISIYKNAAGGKIPFLKIFNETAVAVNQAGVRPGSFACYIESWDLELFDFIDLRKTSGEERRRARDLFLAISYTDLFFKREEENGNWTLFDPRDVPLLTETWGSRFEEAYLEYERQYQSDPTKFNPNTKVVRAREVLKYHINSWCDVGMPFFMFKDTVNNKHKYQHLGPIRSSNLCCFPGDTKVYGSVVFKDESLLKQQDEKGRHYVTIKQLADYSDNRNEFMILHNNSQGGSRLNSTNDLVYAKAYKSKTFKQKLVKVVLENGSSFKCTPDHRLGLTNGDYVRADESKDRMLHTCDSKGIHVKEVIELEEKEDVYDITIASMNPANQVIHQDDKNFFIIAEDENNIDNRTIVLVHNCEVVQFTSADYTGVCNLGSINLARVNTDEDLKRVTKLANRIMDNCIDLTSYPSKESERFQQDFRAVGLTY